MNNLTPYYDTTYTSTGENLSYTKETNSNTMEREFTLSETTLLNVLIP